ncbi:cytochrome P450 [Primorskyibacter aestuariivivens]|uniref:cytochrome P450 n=1 Tax=Primorskyibacter aestuariivivens TaxID=1888912 RepID=UPI002300ABEC|nr:cytochrome P450 [Primorskyibacter aestuariivivens]MDA7428629.1 cytochrome P450 [Primorskyibacter aestuariivivens]
MTDLHQSPTDPDFFQNPYPFYAAARAQGAVHRWVEYDLDCAFSHAVINACLRDGRLGREVPEELRQPTPEHLRDFYAIDDNSMLELEGARHTRLRKLVLRAFTSRRIAALGPEIEALCHDLIDRFPSGDHDLLHSYASRVPVIVIARLLGIPDDMADQLLRWSNDMVAIYQARRDRAVEIAANTAARDFASYLSDYIGTRRKTPGDDLITHLIAAEEDGESLSTPELIATCVLLLNAGHEATVHTMGNGVKALLENGARPEWLAPDAIEGTVEEILRYDPPLHMFTRYAYADVEIGRFTLKRGQQIGLMLGAAGRDPQMWDEPDRFAPTRPVKTHVAFGAGRHFCVGAPLARLELQIALPILFERCPGLSLAETPRYANLYHFHGLERLVVRV